MADNETRAYRAMMTDSFMRERVRRSRLQPLRQRMASVVASAMAFGALTPAVPLALDLPLGGLLAVGTAAAALYSLQRFLFDSTVLYVDLRRLDAELRGRALAAGEA
jgi:hypothetical protein